MSHSETDAVSETASVCTVRGFGQWGEYSPKEKQRIKRIERIPIRPIL